MKILITLLILLLGILAAFLLLLVICALAVDPKKDYPTDNRFYRALAQGVVGAILKLLNVHITLCGTEKLPETNRVLFVGNHRSNFDPMVTWVSFKQYAPAYLSKGANLRIPVVGRIIRRCCFTEIDRGNPRNAIRAINRAAQLLSQKEVSIGVYPEGTRSKDCTLLPFHNGVFKIAQKANVPIVVLAVSGTENIHKNAPFRRTEVRLEVAAVLNADEKTAVLGERVRTALEQCL